MATSPVYERLTADLIAKMEAGKAPWIRTWRSHGAERNVITDKPYRGFNQLVLSFVGAERGYRSPYWLTYRQATELGGHVKAGQSGPERGATPVVLWKFLDKQPGGEAGDNEDGKSRRFPLVRYYSLFNADQCEGIQCDRDLYPSKGTPPPTPSEAQAAAKQLMEQAFLCPIKVNGRDPSYYPIGDYIELPHVDQYATPDDFFHDAFHEMAHATSHPTRLNRERSETLSVEMRRGSYAKEELVAEMAAAFMCSHVGLNNERVRNNSAAYLAGWAKRCREEPNLLINAAQNAQKATDWILGVSPEVELARKAKQEPEVVEISPPAIEDDRSPSATPFRVLSSRGNKIGDLVRWAWRPENSPDATPDAHGVGIVTDIQGDQAQLDGWFPCPQKHITGPASPSDAARVELNLGKKGGFESEDAARTMAATFPHLNLQPVKAPLSPGWSCVKPIGQPVKNTCIPPSAPELFIGDPQRFEGHDSNTAVFLGHLVSQEGRADLYFDENGPFGLGVIARHSAEDGDYTVGSPFGSTGDQLAIASARAAHLKLVSPESEKSQVAVVAPAAIEEV